MPDHLVVIVTSDEGQTKCVSVNARADGDGFSSIDFEKLTYTNASSDVLVQIPVRVWNDDVITDQTVKILIKDADHDVPKVSLVK